MMDSSGQSERNKFDARFAEETELSPLDVLGDDAGHDGLGYATRAGDAWNLQACIRR